MNARFNGSDYRVKIETYRNGGTAIVLVGHDGVIAAVATVNIPEAPLLPHQVLIKDYSENRGMLTALEKAGIVRATGTYIRCGHASMPLCRLLVPRPGLQKVSEKSSPQEQRGGRGERKGNPDGSECPSAFELSLGELRKTAEKTARPAHKD